jgi:Protein of unknown function (DUF402)
MWSEGDAFLVRYESADGVIRGARPTRVVGERNGYLATWLPAATPVAVPVLADGRGLRECSLEDRYTLPRASRVEPWRGEGILMLFPRAAAHSVWLFWREDGGFWGWYVNLERRHRWNGRGCDTRDHVLDLWCEVPREWHWKDEDELEQAVEHGVVSPAQAAEIRAEGERVARAIERWEPPFGDGWETWRPDPSWPAPVLPDDWHL